VSWRVRASLLSPPIALRAIRPGGAAIEATGAGTSAAGDPVSNTITSFGVNPGLPIRTGDGVGIDVPFDQFNEYLFSEFNVGETNLWIPPLADGWCGAAPAFYRQQRRGAAPGCHRT
jgi:hypothetical protein